MSLHIHYISPGVEMSVGQGWPEDGQGEDKDGTEEVEKVTQGQAHHQPEQEM